MEEITLLRRERNENWYRILFAVLLGILFDRLFLDHEFGISFFIYISLCIAFFLWTVRNKIKFEKNFGWFLIIPIALLAFSFTVYTNGILRFLNALLIPFLMVMSSLLINDSTVQWDRISFAGRLFGQATISVFCNIYKPIRFIKEQVQMKNKIQLEGPKKQIVIGVAISIPLLAVILALLSSADMVFHYYIENFTELFKNINIGNILGHTIIIAVVFLYLIGYVWSFNDNSLKEKEQYRNKTPIEPLTIITVLLFLNLLYLFFTIIQSSYLYGGENQTLPAAFTYAEYARKGFFELVAVTFINFIIVLSCCKRLKEEKSKLVYMGKALFTILILFTLNMLYSANFKMSLYESSYGYTYLRVFVRAFMLVLCILCIITMIGIWYGKVQIMKSIIITTIVMYTAFNYFNVDAFIARKNIERYLSTGKLDANYLVQLSDDAVPDLLKVKDVDIIRENLRDRKEQLQKKGYWGEFNFSKNSAKKLLEGF